MGVYLSNFSYILLLGGFVVYCFETTFEISFELDFSVLLRFRGCECLGYVVLKVHGSFAKLVAEVRLAEVVLFLTGWFLPFGVYGLRIGEELMVCDPNDFLELKLTKASALILGLGGGTAW